MQEHFLKVGKLMGRMKALVEIDEEDNDKSEASSKEGLRRGQWGGIGYCYFYLLFYLLCFVLLFLHMIIHFLFLGSNRGLLWWGPSKEVLVLEWLYTHMLCPWRPSCQGPIIIGSFQGGSHTWFLLCTLRLMPLKI